MEALRSKALNGGTLAIKNVHDNASIRAQGQLEQTHHLSDFLSGINIRNKLVNKITN